MSLRPGDILVQNERIAALMPVYAGEAGEPDLVIDAKNCLVLPGMVNASLVPQSGLWKGLFGEQEIRAVLDGLRAAGAGTETSCDLEAELTYYLTLLAGCEMLHCGVTTVVHQWSRITQNTPQVQEAAARAYRELGIRAIMADDLPESGRDVLVYNPLSGLYSGEPLLPIYKYQANGTPLALGTGAFNGGNHNMFDVLKMTFAMQRILQPDYHLWPTVEQVLQMATTNGARLCGLQSEIGSLEVGKQADIALYDVRGFSFSPLNNPLDQFVCLEDGSSLDMLMLGGRVVVEYGQVRTVDEEAVKQRVHTLFGQISQATPAALQEG